MFSKGPCHTSLLVIPMLSARWTLKCHPFNPSCHKMTHHPSLLAKKKKRKRWNQTKNDVVCLGISESSLRLIPKTAPYVTILFLISNKFIDVKKKGNTLVHRKCTRVETIKNKNYKNLKNQEKIKMIDSAMQPTNPLQF